METSDNTLDSNHENFSLPKETHSNDYLLQLAEDLLEEEYTNANS